MRPFFPFSAGLPRPLGANPREGGVNFALYTGHGTAVELLLYARAHDPEPAQTIRLEHRQHRSVNTWHVFVLGVGHGQCYAWRVHGPWNPSGGHRFDATLSLLDPYARLIVPRTPEDAAHEPEHGASRSGRYISVVVDPRGFDWRDVTPPRVHPSERIIYEMHLAGFTKDPSAVASRPGTFDALIERIPWIVELGVTTVELLPIFSFDPHAPDRHDPTTGESLRDYWGYNPLGFFSPHHAYLDREPTGADSVQALQELVRALHGAGLEVFLDVVFNHTGEFGLDGPTHGFRGIDNATYYLVSGDGSGRYVDFSGCGNTVRCGHPAVRRMILDSLRYWTTYFHIDGFRFDLASILSRDDQGRPVEHPPLLWEIEGDPVLENATLVAEAWDAGGLYQVGRFPGERWCEWNGLFRDDVRRFWRGEPNLSGAVAQRMLGSPDLYEAQDRQPSQGVNFVTCHDGFTLADLVSYEHKRNLGNGEDNRDGGETRTAMNCGVEGPTDDPAVNALRRLMTKNLLTTLLIAQGTPMLLSGDEIGRTQRGNSNAWCQDNAVSWTDWGLLRANADLYRFVCLLIRFRRSHHSLHRSRYLLGHDAPEGHDTPGYTRVRWHGLEPDRADWGPENRLLCYTLTPAEDDVALHIMLNAGADVVEVVLPREPRGGAWLRVIDTSLSSPDDIGPLGSYKSIKGQAYSVVGRSAVVLIGNASLHSASERATQAVVVPGSLRADPARHRTVTE
ncbi:MAG: glycogen debranching protein GlgX [Vicinamibacteria bacterium]|nr:glycogen debranching protein GlgX [Vicinamibacteria bacterium]